MDENTLKLCIRMCHSSSKPAREWNLIEIGNFVHCRLSICGTQLKKGKDLGRGADFSFSPIVLTLLTVTGLVTNQDEVL